MVIVLDFDIIERSNSKRSITFIFYGGARRVMAIVVGNGLGDTSSNPARN